MAGVTGYVKGRLGPHMTAQEAAAAFYDPLVSRDIAAFITRWDQMYNLSFLQIRGILHALASAQTFYHPDDGQSEWLFVRDDDDIHLAVPQECFDQPDDVVMVGFSTDIYSLIPPFGRSVHRVTYISGCLSNGYAIRRSYLNSLTDNQRKLILCDHSKCHAFVHFSGCRYVFYPDVVGGVYVRHPASASMALQKIPPEKVPLDMKLIWNWAENDDASIPQFVRTVARVFAGLRRRLL